MTAWPEAALIEAEDYRITPPTDVIRTEFDDGLARQARQYTGGLLVRSIRFRMLTDADMRAFLGWARAHAHKWFDFPAPEDEPGSVPRRCRVVNGAGGITLSVVTDGTARSWQAEAELEEAV